MLLELELEEGKYHEIIDDGDGNFYEWIVDIDSDEEEIIPCAVNKSPLN